MSELNKEVNSEEVAKTVDIDTLYGQIALNEKDKTKAENIVQEINISFIDEFDNHPFYVKDDEDMEKLIDSIRENGVLIPAFVRPKGKGRFELISGHRRKHAVEKLGQKTLKCIVSNCDDDTATIMMVDSNIHRSTILPSEKAHAYKMRYDAMKHQGKSSACATPLHKSREIMAQEVGESHEQIRKYIRLNELVPELLQLVDDGLMGMRPAVELSYLDEDAQRDLVDAIDLDQATPSHAQAIRLRKYFNDGLLTTEIINEIMEEEKPNQKSRFSITSDKLEKHLPKGMPRSKIEKYVITAVEYYTKHVRNKENMER